MRIAFATLRYTGHLNPMTCLARKMRQRGHDVFFVGVPDAAPAVRAAGLDFVPVAEREFPAGSWLARDAHLAKLSGLAGLRFTIQGLCSAFDAVARDCPDVLRRMGAEAAVFDQLAAGYSAAASRVGLPTIHVALAAPGNPWNSAPPVMVGWRYRGGTVGKVRNRTGHALFRSVARPYTARIYDYYKQCGVNFDDAGPSFGCSKLAQITQMPAAFDFPNPALPEWFHHTGPFEDGRGRAEVPFPWERLTGQPLIYASMGTVQNGFENVFRTIIAACDGLDCQLVLSVGANLTPESLGAAANCIAVNHAPQVELLRRARLCITHAGLNTVLESLSNGVPMVAIPVTNDQPGVAARIAYTRTGVVVPFRKLTMEGLRQAVRQVLDNSLYQENALALQVAIRNADGLERAATIIDRCLGHGRAERHSHVA